MDLHQELYKAFKKIDDLTERVNELENHQRHLNNKVEQITKEKDFYKNNWEEARIQVNHLQQENFQLKVEVTDIKGRLNSNSSNSNKPPSSDGFKKAPALPKTKKGSRGGQKGHKGNTLHQIINPDKIIQCKPSACSCGHIFEPDQLKLAEKRQVFDLPKPKLDVTEYQLLKGKCPCCGKYQLGNAPQGVNAPVQYGNTVKAVLTLMNVHYKLPFKKIQRLFVDLYNAPINESTVYSAGEQCYHKLQATEQIIKSYIVDSDVVHADETGVRVEGSLHWLHTATTELFTYLFVDKKRGSAAMNGPKSVLEKLKNWLVHDCWHSYFYLPLNHALCGAHLLRELQWLIEVKNSKWAAVFKSFLLMIYQMPFDERMKRRQIIEGRYDRICQIGEMLEPAPVKTKGKQKRTPGRNLVERLIKHKAAALAFAFNENVPFTNNLAERDIRPVKLKLKVSNSFRTSKGADIYARIEGFISTARKNQRNILEELCSTFEGTNFIAGVPS